MIRWFLCLAAILCFSSVFFVSSAYAVVDEAISSADQTPYFPHQIIVKYKEGQNPDDLAQRVQERSERGRTLFGKLRNFGENVAARVNGQETPEMTVESLKNLEARIEAREKKFVFKSQIEKDFGGIVSGKPKAPWDNYILFETSSRVETLEAVEEFNNDPRVQFAEPNYRFRAMLEPNDTYWEDGRMWGLEKIQMPDAWGITTGSTSVTVAVLDTGVDYNHVDFEGVPFDDCGSEDCDFVDDDSDPMDEHYHGTHVAGTIGAATNNDLGIPGINWEVTLMAVRVLDATGFVRGSSLLDGIAYAVNQGADVINMSIGSDEPGTCPSVYQEVFDHAYNEGVVTVVAAGNKSGNAASYPFANCNHVIAVGASTPGDSRADFSNYGSAVDVAAPGTNIWSLTPGDTVGILSGTSMAAPHVSGLAALLLAQNPGLNPDQVKSKIVDYADAIDTDQPIGSRINAYRSLSAGGQATPTAIPTPTPTPTAGPTAPPTGGPTATPSPGVVTRLDLTVKLQGIDSQKRNRGMVVTVDSHQYSPVFNGSEGGRFKGTVENPGIGSGNYTLAVKEPHHLTKEFPATLFAGANDIVRVSTGDELRAGDIDSDDDIDGNDKTALLNTYSPFSVVDPAVVFGDLNEDGYVNSLDYSLFLTNLGGLPTPIPTASQSPSPTGSGTPSPTATPTPSPDWKYWSGTVTVNDPDELEPYVFVGVCEVDSEGEDCLYTKDDGSEWYVYREPEDDGAYQFGGLDGHWYKTFALATDCRESDTETGNPKFPYRPCSFDPDDYYDTDGPTWVSPPKSGVNFSLEIAEGLAPPPQTSYDIPVLAIKYFPDEDGDGRLDQEETGINEEIEVIRERVATFTEETVVALEKGSTYHGYKNPDATPSLEYEIVEEKEFLKPVPTEARAGARPADHVKILTREGFDICDYVENEGVKEVWIWMYHTDDVYPVESYQRGPYGGIGNGFMNLPLCGKTYTVYDYNYGAGTGFNVEDHTHHLESLFRWVNSKMFDDKFVGLPGEHEYYRCGWTHCPPNTIEFCVPDHEYDWCNERTVLSDCEDWKPDGSGEKKEVACHTWESGCNPNNCRGLFRIWWMQNIPGLNNNVYDGSKKLRNWWDFVGDFDRAMERGKNFY